MTTFVLTPPDEIHSYNTRVIPLDGMAVRLRQAILSPQRLFSECSANAQIFPWILR